MLALPRRVVRRLTQRPQGNRFEAATLARYGVDTRTVDDPTVQMWIDYTLSSVERGRQVVAAMGGRPAFKGRSVLDVGCAYGGFLVAASEAGARRVVGIDIDSKLLEFARLQLDDYRVQAEIAEADFTSDGMADRFGSFDIVLCSCVIEHVVDPVVCAANLASVLRPGGRVFLEIPNALAAEYMHKDGHYGLFGITLLGREQAERLWGLHFNDRYGVEHYAPLAYYLQIFSAVGISLRQISRVESQEKSLQEIGESLDRLETELASFDPPEAPDLAVAIRKRGAEEIERFRQLRSRLDQSSIPAERAILTEEIVSTYGMTVWTLEGTKL